VTKSAQAPGFEITKQGASAGMLHNELVFDLFPSHDAINNEKASLMQTVRISFLQHILYVCHVS